MFIMGRTRRGFTPEYKDEAVKLVINTGRPVATVAREQGNTPVGSVVVIGKETVLWPAGTVTEEG